MCIPDGSWVVEVKMKWFVAIDGSQSPTRFDHGAHPENRIAKSSRIEVHRGGVAFDFLFLAYPESTVMLLLLCKSYHILHGLQ